MDSDYPTKRGEKARANEAVRATSPDRPPPTPAAAVDASLELLDERAPLLASMPASERARRLRGLLRRFHELSRRMVALDCAAKGLDPQSPLAGEPAFEGPAIILRYAERLASVLEGTTRVGPEAARNEGGRTVVQLLPRDGYERVLFPGWRAEAWFPAEVPPGGVATHPSELVTQPPGVALVLGAGNVASIGIVDALQQVFALGRACVLKVSPVNDYLGPLLELAFAPLVAEGFFAFAYGGRELGEHLVTHPLVTHVHVTGAAETHEAIVWGPPEGRAERKARHAPALRKPVTSELGNVSPAIVLPGHYTDSELSHAARNIVGSHTFNAAFNCNGTKLLVMPASPLRERLLAEIARVFETVAPRVAYYPGAAEKYRRFTEAGGRLRAFGAAGAGELPWALVSDLTPEEDAACFRDEPFCAVLSEVSLRTADPVEFMAAATRFVNDRVWGTLNAMIIAPASVERDPVTAASLDRMLRDLRYGAVCVNVWPAAAYGLGTFPWGGHPSATLADAQSGLGWGHNALLLHDVEKTVLRAPLVPLVKPLWYPGHRTLDRLALRFADFSAAPGPGRLVQVAAAALRG
jgi:acyl-CoA reductase-like NAD-dependent aldehyde dehydrogenase